MVRPGVFAVLLLLVVGAVARDRQHLKQERNLCSAPGCSCIPSPSHPALVDVSCSCVVDQQLTLGVASKSPGSLQPPANTVSLVVEGCHRLELHSRLVNHLGELQKVAVKGVHTLLVQPNLYEARGRSREAGANLTTVEFTNIQHLEVKRFAFKDLEITGRFFLGEVTMTTVMSMAFTFSYVKEFSVFASKFDRISMFGIKLPRCREFNVLGMTRFGSLGAHAVKVRCDKFSLAYNWFGRLHDSSFEVEYGLCDIQGNTFSSLGGRPFLALQPLPAGQVSGPSEIAMSGLVFRENKFAAEPVLPFGALAMPAFDRLKPEASYIDIEGNQFPCSCQRLGWFLAFGEFGLNRHSLAEVGSKHGSGTVSFLSQLYSSAGPCVACERAECATEPGRPRQLGEFAGTALVRSEAGAVQCGEAGLTVRDYDNGDEGRTGDPGAGVSGLAPQPWREAGTSPRLLPAPTAPPPAPHAAAPPASGAPGRLSERGALLLLLLAGAAL